MNPLKALFRDRSSVRARLAGIGRYALRSDAHLTRQVAREIQVMAATHLPMLTGDLMLTEESVGVTGRAVMLDNLYGNVRFFMNGLPLEEVEYPLPENDPKKFTEVGGAMAFQATTRANFASLMRDKFLRIDASPTGVYRPQAWRQAWWFMNPRHESLPMPPAQNIRRVVGDESPTRFGMGGLTIYQNVTAMLRELGFDWARFARTLDWGCGAGRITRYLIAESGSEVHGADIDADNVSWCAENLKGAQFHHLPLAPPTRFENNMFDLVIGASVVTHLTEPMQFAWLEELRRITRPGALVFLSVAGACQYAHMGIEPDLYRRAQKRGFLDFSRDASLDGFIANAEYYRSTWHSRAYIVETWSKYFDIITFADGIAALQDFVVMRRPAD